MEEQTQTLAQTLPPQPPPPSQPPQSITNNNKRPLDNIGHIQNSSYYKMRALLNELRPHFIEVLRTPDFQNCKAACDIREKMKVMMDLYKETTADTVVVEQHQDVKPTVPPPPPADRVDKPVILGNVSEKPRSEDGRMVGTYIVGGSAFGWNFITYPGGKAVYYGRTKESFRSENVGPQ